MTTPGRVLHHLRVYAGLTTAEATDGTNYTPALLAAAENGDASCNPGMFATIADTCVHHLDHGQP